MGEPVLNVTASTNACAQRTFQETFAKQSKVINADHFYV